MSVRRIATLVFVAIVLVVVVAAGVGYFLFVRQPGPGGSQGGEPDGGVDENQPDGGPDEEDNYPEPVEGLITFTCLPLNENDYNEIYPLGSLSPPGHTFPTDHVYFKLKTPWTYPPPYQVKAPADGIITEIYYSQYDWPEGSGHSGKYDDYSITITHTGTFKIKFGHISELENWVLEQAGTLELGWNPIETPVPVSVGDVVGRLAGCGGVQGDLDMWAIDENVTLNFIHPEKYSYAAHAVCPLDYFEDNLKAALYQKVSRTAEPRGGKIDFDQPGKLVGNWFLENITDPLGGWEKHLAFVYDRPLADKGKCRGDPSDIIRCLPSRWKFSGPGRGFGRERHNLVQT